MNNDRSGRDWVWGWVGWVSGLLLGLVTGVNVMILYIQTLRLYTGG